ncbi:MAG: hypothetical protein KF795_16795 [Labilithrix sp.]|nr:hypothetical protein [Labilithrix sp.]
MRAVGREMSEDGEDRGGGAPSAGREARSALLADHAPVLGRVAMALVGDPARVEQVLEQVAREAGAAVAPDGVAPLAWLLGLVRAASATQLSKLPLRTRPGREDAAPTTERMGAGEAIAARAALATLKPTEREAVILSLVGGLEAADVAAACGVDVGTAKTRIARGVEQLLESRAPGDDGGAR